MKKVFSIIAAAALTLSASAQQSVHDDYVGVSFGGGLNTMLYQPANGQHKLGCGFDAGLFYGHFFNQTVGLGFGVQYSWANAYTTYNWSEVTTGLQHPSNPYTPYNLTAGFNDFVERQNVGVISVPVEVLFRKPLNDRAAFIAGVGVALDLPIHGAYTAKSGSYSTTGVFPAIGSYVLSDMPEHGFSTYTTTQNAKFNNRAKVGGSVIADLGFRVALGDMCGMYFGIYAGYGFTNLLASAKSEEMIMVNATDPAIIDYRGTFDSNETGKANLLRCGAKIAIDLGFINKKDHAATDQLPAVAEEPVRVDAEQARLDSIAKANAQAEADRLALEKAEAERKAREKAERDRIEAERRAAEKAAAEAAAREEAFRRSVETFSVHFSLSNSQLSIPEEEQKIVDELCERMKVDKSIKIVITGHTDNSGDPQQNLNYYGVERAKALCDYMVNQGVDINQIRCESKGDKEPIATNETREGRAMNRRACIRFE